ncbi:MAG: response regulator [Ideonella sp.]
MNSSPYLILVIDDEPDHRAAIEATLRGDGVSILQVESGAAALRMLETSDIALVLMAIKLNDIDGFQLIRQIRNVERMRRIPIVLLSRGERQPVTEFPSFEGGMVDFLYHAEDQRALAAKVHVFMDLHQQQREMADRLEETKRLSRLNALMIGALSHDIRTPLAALALNAELVIRRADQAGLRQAGERMKAATATLGRQVDHLVNLSSLPGDDLRPELVQTDLAALARNRIDVASEFMLAGIDVTLQVDGEDVRGVFDPVLIGEALDQLLLLCAIHGAGVPVRVQVDGHSLRSLALRVTMDLVLPDAACQHLFGGGRPVPGLPPSQVGPGLHATERVARAHGGSFVGRSRDRQGTLFELILPRTEG